MTATLSALGLWGRFGRWAVLSAALVWGGLASAEEIGANDQPAVESRSSNAAPSVTTVVDAQSSTEVRSFAERGQVIAQGLASWYGGKFHGRRTASGEPYDKNALTAAHKTLPFGSLVRVKSVRTGKEVVVRINDRGPYARQRVIDLSGAAAAALGIKGRGVATVILLRE